MNVRFHFRLVLGRSSRHGHHDGADRRRNEGLTHTAAHVENIKKRIPQTLRRWLRCGGAFQKGLDMTKKELKQYRHLEREIATLETYISNLERKAEKVPTVKDKVQSSQAEFPYVQTHVTVDAPEPHAYTKIQRLIIRNERLKDDALAELMRLDNYIHSVPDDRARTILIAVYINGRSQAQVAIDMDLSYQRVSNIISEILKKY